jgi:AcrR family transcriptional regulator
MKTNELIKHKSLELFNQNGVMNVTLRDVGKELKKSYGNLTYHFATKEILIKELHEDMNKELQELQSPNEKEDLLLYFLMLPSISFEITVKYLFFMIDFVEIKRNFPIIFKTMSDLAVQRKIKWKMLLQKLQALGYLNNSLEDQDLEYIMFLSGSVRAAYFQIQHASTYNKSDFVIFVNNLLKPYLSDKGLLVFKEYEKNHFA